MIHSTLENAPTLTTHTTTGTTATLTWTPGSANEGDYIVSYRTAAGVTAEQSFSGLDATPDDVTRTITGLSAGTTYTVVVRRGRLGRGSNPIDITTGQNPPVVTTGATTATSVALSWTSGTIATGTYQVQYKLASQSMWATFAETEAGTSTTVTGLTSGRDYNFRVRRGMGPYGLADASTMPTAPVLTVGTITPTSVALSWTTGQ